MVVPRGYVGAAVAAIGRIVDVARTAFVPPPDGGVELDTPVTEHYERYDVLLRGAGADADDAPQKRVEFTWNFLFVRSRTADGPTDRSTTTDVTDVTDVPDRLTTDVTDVTGGRS